MKKILYSTSVLLCASMMLVTGCKKDTTPFPTNQQSNSNPYSDFAYGTPYFPTLSNADGILIAAQVTDVRTVVVSPFSNEYEYGMAKFATSTGNFMSLMDMGTVTLNDSNLTKGSDFSYLSNTSSFSLGLSSNIVWSVNSVTVAVTGPMPSYTYTPNLWDKSWIPLAYKDYTQDYVPTRPTITHLSATSLPADSSYYNTNKDSILVYLADSTTRANDSVYDITTQYSVPLKGYVSNADSVSIVLMDKTGYVFIKTLVPTDTIHNQFKPVDFKNYTHGYDPTTFNVQVNAYSYQPQTVGTKNYYFLKLASYIKYAQPTK